MKAKKSKLIVFVLVALALVIPVLLAMLFLRENMNSDLRRGSVNSILLTYGEREEEIVDEKEIEFFISAATGGSAIGESADDLSQYRNLTVTFHKYNQSIVYQFYLSDSQNNCVYTDPDGNLFLFPHDVAEKLQTHKLLEDYALSFAEYPLLTLQEGGKEYQPNAWEGQWHFVRADGKKENQSIDEKKDSLAILPQGEKLNFVFSIEPDYCNVLLSVKDSEQLIYSGMYHEMPVIDLEEDTPLTMTVTCDWYEKEDRSYHGSVFYTFDVYYDIPTICQLDRAQARPGEVITLTVSHSSSQQMAVIPSFSADHVTVEKQEKNWVATIPVSADATPGTFSIMIMGSDVEQNLNVTILPPA